MIDPRTRKGIQKCQAWPAGKCNAECIDPDVLCRGLRCATPHFKLELPEQMWLLQNSSTEGTCQEDAPRNVPRDAPG
eukprot:3038385-Pyramimonas_sp.AAC.1